MLSRSLWRRFTRTTTLLPNIISSLPLRRPPVRTQLLPIQSSFRRGLLTTKVGGVLSPVTTTTTTTLPLPLPPLNNIRPRVIISILKNNKNVIQQRRHAQILLPPERGPRRKYKRFGDKDNHQEGPNNQYYKYIPSRGRPVFYLWRTSQNFRIGVGLVGIGGGLFYFSNIETVPVSGRRRFNIISPSTEIQVSKSMYESILAEFGDRILPSSHPYTKLVRQVMERLVPVSGLEKELDWEVHVIADDRQKNAFVIPGGKVFVFSGIIPVCKTSPFDSGEEGLAAVLSHEISHVLAHHASERMSQMFLVVVALWTAALLLGSGGNDGGLGRILMDLLFLKPGSRKQEAEADYIGLLMMAKACYDPENAMVLWKNMEAVDKVQTPQFLNTHPAHRTRLENIKQWLPEAKQQMETTDCYNTLGYAKQFKNMFYPTI